MREDDDEIKYCEECGQEAAFAENIRGCWRDFCSEDCAKKNRPIKRG